MNHKRRKSRKNSRLYSGSMGPRDSGGDGWRRGNHASRFRVRELGRRQASLEEMELDEQVNIRVILDEVGDAGGRGAELYRIPIDDPETNSRAVSIQSLEKVRKVVAEEPLVRGAWLSTMHNDVEVRLNVLLDELRMKKGIAVVTPLVEHIVSRLAEAFTRQEVHKAEKDMSCPRCLNMFAAWGEDWDDHWGTCKSCAAKEEEEEEEELTSDWDDNPGGTWK